MYPSIYWQKQLGQWFGPKYLLREFLGCGAFGAVFRADEMLADRVMQSVAIKIVITDPDNLEIQLDELQLSVRLRHPHLINGITCEQGELNGDLCLGLVMELADATLESYYAKHPQGLSVETVTTIAQHLAAGLSALHEDGITHRDLKPANVLLVKDKWKLGDFGIARSLQDKTSTYTSPSQQIGTVAYMPPEAYSGKISLAWDVWALGVIIHQLLSGQHPFPTQFAPELMRMVLMEEPKIDPNLPVSLREIVAGCLVKDTQQRWNAGRLLQVLEPGSQPKPFTTIIEDLGGGVTLELIQLPAGQFMMGASTNDGEADNHEKPQHLVKVKAFAMGRYPITQTQYEAVMGKNPSMFKENPKNPVEMVSWHDANEFCQKLSQVAGKKYRLSSEAEWEYACRAGTTTRYFFGDHVNQLGEYAWFRNNSGIKTHPVGKKRPNPWGLYDMHGNVWEWCEDTWHSNYQGAPFDGLSWIQGDKNIKTLRGGSMVDSAWFCRSSNRGGNSPNNGNSDYGFRVVFSF
jgi:formylglycine-generating enzyme required for sulfatase activity